MATKKYTGGGFISLKDSDRQILIKEDFRGLSFDKQSTFPKGLGAEHPFNFESIEKLYKKYGVITGAINKFTDSVISNFEIKLKNANAQTLIDSFIHDTNFYVTVREWIREGLLKGNGFIELDLDNQKIRILNANFIYVKRNKKGKVLEYNQWTRPFKGFRRDAPDLVTFKPNQIAHLLINKIPNDPYGIGIVWPNERVIENLVLNEQDLQKLISRKAGSPYHFKVGQPGTNVPQSVVDDVNSKLQFLTNRTEWVTDGDIDIKTLSFPDLGKNLVEAQMYFFRMLLAGLEIPEVLMGSGQLNEGIAKVQLETFKRKISTIQTHVSIVIEEKIIRPLLRANNLDEQPEFIWELPTEDDINKRIERITKLLSSMSQISPVMKAGLELELAKLMKLEETADILPTPEQIQKQTEEQEAEDREREQEENIPQPEVPGAKPNANQSNKSILESSDIKIKDWINIQEIAGFNYTDYLVKILEVLNIDDFVNLRAITEADVVSGLLPENEIEKLRIVLKDGFRKNQSIREIENNILSKVNLKERKIGDKIISITARVTNIARTETVRLANDGLVKLYKENKIEKVRFLAALSSRTCPICEGLNGQVFDINELSVGTNQPPIHNMCRCSLVSILE